MLHTWSLNAPDITQLEGKNECKISSSCLHSILPRNQQEKRDPCQIYKVLFSLKTFKENQNFIIPFTVHANGQDGWHKVELCQVHPSGGIENT